NDDRRIPLADLRLRILLDVDQFDLGLSGNILLTTGRDDNGIALCDMSRLGLDSVHDDPIALALIDGDRVTLALCDILWIGNGVHAATRVHRSTHHLVSLSLITVLRINPWRSDHDGVSLTGIRGIAVARPGNDRVALIRPDVFRIERTGCNDHRVPLRKVRRLDDLSGDGNWFLHLLSRSV